MMMVKRTLESYLSAMIARRPLGHVYLPFFPFNRARKRASGIIYKPVSRFRSCISVDGNVDNSSDSLASWRKKKTNAETGFKRLSWNLSLAASSSYLSLYCLLTCCHGIFFITMNRQFRGNMISFVIEKSLTYVSFFFGVFFSPPHLELDSSRYLLFNFPLATDFCSHVHWMYM